jgi:hypothetical protein
MPPEPETREMQIEQKRREQSHRDAADDATEEHEVRSEKRRADKAAYLREKLDERADSEDDAD